MPAIVSILLATYNGEQYLSEQIKSILEQSCKCWQLIIRDDGSSDNTPEIIKEFTKKYSDVIKLIIDGDGNVGTSQNFLRLLQYAKTDYVMFCDQDDIWLPDKIEITLNKMKEVEESYGSTTPILIHTDLKVTDKNSNVISGSFWKHQKLNPEKGKTFNRMLVQNVVTGCTAMINKALKNKITLLPDRAAIYDWWIALVAAAFGRIDYVPTSTILYRQHTDNLVGAKRWDINYIMKMLFNMPDIKTALQKTQSQAKAFLDTFKYDLTDEYLNLLTLYSNLSQQGFFRKRLNLIKYDLLKTGLLRNIGLFFAV